MKIAHDIAETFTSIAFYVKCWVYVIRQKLRGGQAATAASDARYQARIKELEEALQSVLDCIDSTRGKNANDAVCHAQQVISTTTPDTALQRKVLEARIDEREDAERLCERRAESGGGAFARQCKRDINARTQELRAQLAALGE